MAEMATEGDGEKALTVEEFCKGYKVGRTKAHEELASGRLKSYKLGRRRYTTPVWAAEWQRALAEAEVS